MIDFQLIIYLITIMMLYMAIFLLIMIFFSVIYCYYSLILISILNLLSHLTLTSICFYSIYAFYYYSTTYSI